MRNARASSPFREVCGGDGDSSLHYSRISNPVSISSLDPLPAPPPPCHLLPFLPHSDPFISTFVTAFSVVRIVRNDINGGKR